MSGSRLRALGMLAWLTAEFAGLVAFYPELVAGDRFAGEIAFVSLLVTFRWMSRFEADR